jgi:uncharacterized protein (DUF2147 family)
MQRRVIAPAIATLAALLVAGGIPARASAADPSGIWAKDDGSAKMEVTKCGKGVCSKIVWLQSPKDSRGKPLVDARNENTSMRKRPILGLSLFSNMVPKAPNTWVGSVYNPEEGRIYTDVTVTLVSSRQIVLRGCKGWLLCGERVWTKSKLDKPLMDPDENIQPKGDELIEVKAPKPESEESVVEAKNEAGVSSATKRHARSDSDIEFAKASAAGPGAITILPALEPLQLTGETVSSMMVMTDPRVEAEPTPADPTTDTMIVEASADASVTEAAPPVGEGDIETETAEAPAAEEAAPKPKPKLAQKPKPSGKAVTRASAAEVPAAKPKPKVRQASEQQRERLPWERP